jgi:hypothetical protein
MGSKIYGGYLDANNFQDGYQRLYFEKHDSMEIEEVMKNILKV